MTPEKVFQCNQCFYESCFKFALKQHEKRHNDRLLVHYPCSVSPGCYKCPQCDFEASLKLDLILHCRLIHKTHYLRLCGNLKLYNCKKCCFKTSSKLISLKHKNLCKIKPKWFNCVQCESEFADEEKLQWHVIDNHKDIKWLDCNEYSVIELQDSSTDKKNSYFKCDFCPFMAQLETSIKLHKLHKHASESKESHFQCTQCPYRTIHSNTLNAHLRSVHAIKPRQTWYQCNKCPYKGASKYFLAQHKRHRHSKDQPNPGTPIFRCNLCPKTYQSKAKLTQHVNNVHNSKKQKIECEFCSFKFKDRGHWKYHVENKLCSPESTKWFRCGHCAFMTNIEFSLKLHEKKCTKKK